MKMESFRKYREMPFVKRGMRVQYKEKWGRVAGANRSCNLNIIFDGEKISKNCHPRCAMRYFDKTGAMVAEYEQCFIRVI